MSVSRQSSHEGGVACPLLPGAVAQCPSGRTPIEVLRSGLTSVENMSSIAFAVRPSERVLGSTCLTTGTSLSVAVGRRRLGRRARMLSAQRGRQGEEADPVTRLPRDRVEPRACVRPVR